MPIINRIAEFHDDMTAWRRDLHAHPETAFEEVRTSDVVAAKLAEASININYIYGAGSPGSTCMLVFNVDNRDTARKLLDVDSTHEEAHRVLMQTYAAKGDNASAVRQYQILLDPERMAAYDVTLADVMHAAEASNAVASGGVKRSPAMLQNTDQSTSLVVIWSTRSFPYSQV